MLAHRNKHSELSTKGLTCYSGMSLGYKQSLQEAGVHPGKATCRCDL